MRHDSLHGAIDAQRAPGRTVVGYAGSMGLPNALDVLLGAAALLRAPGAGQCPARPPSGVEGLGSGPSSLEPDAGIAFVLVGGGLERGRLARRIADERLDAVRLLPPIPKSQVPSFLERVDIAYLGWQRSPIYRDVSAGHLPGGIEYYLPLFFDATAVITDYLPPQRTVVLHRPVHETIHELSCGSYFL